MSWTDPIYDRTQDDIKNRTGKAFFNVADWTRIYTNVLQLNGDFNTLLGVTIPFTTLTTPTTSTIPTVAEINSLIENIDVLRTAVGATEAVGASVLKYDYVGGPYQQAPDFEAVNDWEADLKILYEMKFGLTDYYAYCGVASCGQDRFWQNRFR